ncbi:zinc finger protein 516-like [Sphaeramia orbicularis]|uniref:zinc finger protein 516-like n=1 Tax=Sphaeramia orbicularis TaxID=375764 RepID=UPI00117EBBC1|nr:zinc finger protein 516-like [Sphaeramia orbicularis]XP_030003874.1 zinc finger protein 516-like [Sphaeramia orbicularis]XP_030003875.1 zinc finger protein 516-like [Sphaeramia orbicularis]XP_030003876.1 zinc finger protein 516-like [Sphaeramia orbicularis]
MEIEEKEDVTQKCTATIKAEDDGSSGHSCGVCGRSFPLLSSLSQHMRRHTREKPYKCPYCEHRTAQKGTLKAHIRSHKLGLFTHNLSDKEGDGDQKQKEKGQTRDTPGIVSVSDKAHTINGKVKKKGSKKKLKGKDVEVSDGASDRPFTSSVCSQVFPQVLLLKSHMKKHRNSQDHGCRMCGRRFRQAWFLQSHMRIHRVKAQLKGSKVNELPASINGVPQDPASLINEDCLYELCASCGNFFYDRKTLRAHEKIHQLNRSHSQSQNPAQKDGETSDLDTAKRHFFERLNLECAGQKETHDQQSLGRRIPELDPVCSYQAWQLATRGRLAEATEKCLGWEERLADAEVAYDTEKGEYIPLKQDKKRKPNDTSSIKKKKDDTSLYHTTNTKSGDKRICKDRILLNGLGQAFYEALQMKKGKGVNDSLKQMSFRNQDQEDKNPYLCEHCDFCTVDASLLRSHLQRQHQDFLSRTPCSKQNISGSKASRYMDYLRNRSVLLSQSYWNPYTYQPGLVSAETNIKKEISNDQTEVKGQGRTTSDVGTLLNLSALSSTDGDNTANDRVKTEGLVKHQCPYCSHMTNYPEVLWVHQRVAHKVDSSSSMAPKWAPCSNSLKGLKAGSAQWRRTGPPPFLEGKDCPTLPAPRTHRTKPPSTTTNSSNSSKHLAPKTHSAVPKSKQSTHSKDLRSLDGTHSSMRVGLQPHSKSGEQIGAAEGGSKGSRVHAPSSSSRSFFNSPSASSPKLRGHWATVEGNFPPEGLGFMLARNHSGPSSAVAASRLQAHRKTCDSSAGPKGSDLWPNMNMWGVHGGKAYLDSLLFAQGKNESTAETPMDINILNLLKNYSPHDLTTLYQHWGFVDPRLDPQVILQLNGNFGNEVHSSSEASKQVNSRSTSSGSLHKGS